MKKNIRNTTAEYIQMKSDLQFSAGHVLYEQVAISKATLFACTACGV